MSAYPKLIVFSNKAIPRVKSDFKGASVEVYNLGKLDDDLESSVHRFLLASFIFQEFRFKRATVISGYADSQLTFFRLKNTEYPTAMLKSDDQKNVLDDMNFLASGLMEKIDLLDEYSDLTNSLYDDLDSLDLPNKNKLIKQDKAQIAKSYDIIKELYNSYKDMFFKSFEVDVP